MKLSTQLAYHILMSFTLLSHAALNRILPYLYCEAHRCNRLESISVSAVDGVEADFQEAESQQEVEAV